MIIIIIDIKCLLADSREAASMCLAEKKKKSESVPERRQRHKKHKVFQNAGMDMLKRSTVDQLFAFRLYMDIGWKYSTTFFTVFVL